MRGSGTWENVDLHLQEDETVKHYHAGFLYVRAIEPACYIAVRGELTRCRCAVNCVFSQDCFDKDRNSEDEFLKQSEAGRITSQYKKNDWIDGAGSSSPKHGELKRM
jgi:hypothetical protein